jgi:hypothetical protein
MPLRISLRFAEAVFVSALIAVIFFSWRADRRDRAQLAVDLASSKQALAQASVRQHTRDAQLQQALATIAAQKASVTKPVEILRQLPKEIPLPSPVRLQTEPIIPHAETQPCSSGLPGCSRPEGLDSAPSADHQSGNTTAQGIVLPADDLKPIYDFALGCRACQAKLATAQADLSDERAKCAILAKERDDAIRIANGGSVLRRIERATKWFLIGAAAGAIAAKAHP